MGCRNRTRCRSKQHRAHGVGAKGKTDERGSKDKVDQETEPRIKRHTNRSTSNLNKLLEPSIVEAGIASSVIYQPISLFALRT